MKFLLISLKKTKFVKPSYFSAEPEPPLKRRIKFPCRLRSSRAMLNAFAYRNEKRSSPADLRYPPRSSDGDGNFESAVSTRALRSALRVSHDVSSLECRRRCGIPGRGVPSLTCHRFLFAAGSLGTSDAAALIEACGFLRHLEGSRS